MNRFIKCKECHYNLSHEDNKVACSAGPEIIEFPCDENSGCTSGAYTEEIFPDDYDWEYDKDARLPG